MNIPCLHRYNSAGTRCKRRAPWLNRWLPLRCGSPPRPFYAQFSATFEHLESPVEFQVARSLARERLWALSSLIRSGRQAGGAEGHKYAKQVLLEIAGGTPLTICMGDKYRVRHGERDGVETTAGYMRFAVRGCRAIFEDDVRTSGEMWAGLCKKCRNKARRNQGRLLVTRVNASRRRENATVYVGVPSENACDVPIWAYRAGQRRAWNDPDPA